MLARRRGSTWGIFAVSILISSFLIFQVQPLISKYILPWFGGTPGVWSTCMLFFQVVLFAGYAYAHLLIRYCQPRAQCLIHFSLVILAVLLLPITPSSNWKPTGAEDPTWRILGLLAMTVGLQYFLLSASGPLLQAWFSRANPTGSPYRLYALSNIGSVVGLVSYPFLVEPLLSVETQAVLWSLSFKLYALCCAGCAVVMRRSPVVAVEVVADTEVSTTKTGDRWLWFALPACASVMLLATTNQVCLDIAAIPFLWVLPLTLYLFSFILSFGDARWYPRRTYAVGLAVSIVCLCGVMLTGARATFAAQLAAHFGTLFFCCMVCHGELVRLKPCPRELTSFYLASSAGGAAGGIFVGLIAPFAFNRFVELHIGMFACCVLALVVFFRDHTWVLHAGRPRWAWGCLVVGMLFLARVLRSHAGETIEGELQLCRNFYGVLRVAEGLHDDKDQHCRVLVHGRIQHGRQFLSESRRRIPTAYYGEQSGIGRVLQQGSGPRRVGVIGLGIGTLATYGHAGDVYRFYEINPDVLRLAESHFTFLKDSPATMEHVLGDARLSLEREPDQRFDVLVVDAFSSDAIPAHLLTREAFEVYLKHLAADGVLALHISNRHFDLEPVVRSAARHNGLWVSTVNGAANAERGQIASVWMLLSRAREPLTKLGLNAEDPQAVRRGKTVRLWTDNFSNLVEILK